MLVAIQYYGERSTEHPVYIIVLQLAGSAIYLNILYIASAKIFPSTNCIKDYV